MALMALGVNYQTAAIDIRQRLSFDYQGSVNLARKLVIEGVVSEAVVVSTCNRTELYCEADAAREPLNFLIGQAGATYEMMEPYLYQRCDRQAVIHLMRVATGLDSMILGEAEILGQLKRAYTAAANAGTVGKYLGRLFQRTFGIAKRARTETGIGINPVSVASAAVKLSQHIFTDLSKATVLLIGAGELIQLMMKHLTQLGVHKIMVANRTKANAERLALQFKGEALDLEAIPQSLALADIVITGTASVLPILGKGMVESALHQRKRKPMFMVDLCVPRNIEPEIGRLEDIYLYCVDDLQQVVEENKKYRTDAARTAEAMIEEASEQFMGWLSAQASFKVLSKFRRKMEQTRDLLLQKNLHRLRLGEPPETVLKRLAYHLTNRFLHEPTCRLREVGKEDHANLLTFIREIFELNDETFDTK